MVQKAKLENTLYNIHELQNEKQMAVEWKIKLSELISHLQDWQLIEQWESYENAVGYSTNELLVHVMQKNSSVQGY